MPDYRNPKRTALTNDQLMVAREWLQRGLRNRDSFSQFLDFYTGLNAVYWLFRRHKESEIKALSESLVNSMSINGVEHILRAEGIRGAVDFLVDHGPIRNMDLRSNATPTPATKPEQVTAHSNLQHRESRIRLQGLLAAIYQVRCNLVHGGKSANINGIDYHGVRMLVPVVKAALEVSIEEVENFHPANLDAA